MTKVETAKPDTLGQFEQLVLTAVIALREGAYGGPIYDQVTEMAERRINMGSLYVTLDRLEKKGLLSSRLLQPKGERNRKPKRFYRLEADGLSALQESVATSKRITKIFDRSMKSGKRKSKRGK
ncbi:MAG TPA: helix-turn-helix transcriptional regulator [Terriglobia bacterium]|nr:helix-turn-helix transcriptional regulator [Terriglobia bacterium]